jgi:bacteriocin-like protein
VLYVSPPSQQMEKDVASTIKTSATSEQVREPTCELTEDQLKQVSGGIIAILIGLLLPSAPPSPTKHSM